MSSNPETSQHPIDWDAVRQQLAWDDTRRQQQGTRQRLRQRAAQYAQPLRQIDAPTTDAYIALTFQLGEERYGVEVEHVRGVRALTGITRVPGVPPFYRGVVNVRGQIITAFDVRAFFEMLTTDALPPKEFVLVEASGLQLALLAHHVWGVLRLPRETVEPLDELQYALGVTANGLVLLNLPTLFQDERLIIGGRTNDDGTNR